MSFFYNSAVSYFKTISIFAKTLFLDKPLTFILLNFSGIVSKMIIIVAFMVSIKSIVLVHSGDIQNILDGLIAYQFPPISERTFILVVACFILLLFILSAILPLVYSIKISKYSYSRTSKFRKIKANIFFEQHQKSQEADKEKSKILHQFIFQTDPQFGKAIINVIFHLFELLQNLGVILLSLVIIAYFMPIMTIILIAIMIVLIPVFLWKSYYQTNQTKSMEKKLKELDKSLKQNLMKQSNLGDVDSDFQDYYHKVCYSDKNKKLELSKKRGQLDAKIVQLILRVILGVFFASTVIYVMEFDVNTENLGDMLIVFFIVRFLFGILQSLLTGMRALNTEYLVLKDLIVDIQLSKSKESL